MSLYFSNNYHTVQIRFKEELRSALFLIYISDWSTISTPQSASLQMTTSYMWSCDSTWSFGQYLNKTRLGSMHDEIFKDNFGIFVIYNSWILPTMTYAAETWVLSPQAKSKLATTHTLKEVTLSMTLTDGKTNICCGRKGKDIIEQVRRRKWTCAFRMWCCSIKVFHDATMKYVLKKCGSVLSYFLIIGCFHRNNHVLITETYPIDLNITYIHHRYFGWCFDSQNANITRQMFGIKT